VTIRIQQAVWWQAAAYSPASSGDDFDPTQAGGMSSLRLVVDAGTGVDARYFTSDSAGVLAGKACSALRSFTLNTIDSNNDGQNDTVVDQPTFGVRLGDPSLVDGRVIFNPNAQEALAIFGEPRLVINLEDFVAARVPLSFMLMAVYNSGLSLSCSDRSLPNAWFKHSDIPSGIVDPVSSDELRDAMEPKPQTTSDGLNAGFYVKFDRQAEITQIGCCGVSSGGGGGGGGGSSSSSQAPPSECSSGPTLRSYQPAPNKTRIWAVRSGLRTSINPKLLGSLGNPEWSCFGPTPQELVYAEFDNEEKLDTNLDTSVITWHHAGFLVLEDNYNRMFPIDFAGSSENKSPFLGSMYDTLHKLPVDVVDIAWDDRGWLWALCTGPSRTEGTSSDSPESTVDGIYRVLPGGWSYHIADTFSWGGGTTPDSEVTAKLVASKVGKYKKVACSGNSEGHYTFYLTIDGKVEYVHSASVSPVSPPAAVFSSDAVVIDISAGESHACCVFADGSLLAWAMQSDSNSGANHNHIEGPNSSTGTFTKVACRGKHTVALRYDGKIFSWLDDGTVPTPDAAEGETVVDIGCGSGHVAALFNDSESGSNRVEITGTYEDGSTPRNFSDCDKFACGLNCTIVWQDSTLIFDGPADDYLSNLPDVTTVKQISIGDLHAVLVTEDGSLWSWGHSTYGVDHGVPLTYNNSPLSFDGQIAKFESVSCGIRHTCVITDGTFYEPKYSPAVVAYRSKIEIASGILIPDEPAAVMVKSSRDGSLSSVRSHYDGTTILIGRSEYNGNPFDFSEKKDLKIYDDANKTIRVLSANWRPLKSIASVEAIELPKTCGGQIPHPLSSSHKILPVTHDFSESDWTQTDVDGLTVLQLPEFSGVIHVNEEWESDLANFPQKIIDSAALQHFSPNYITASDYFDMGVILYNKYKSFHTVASCFSDSDFVPGSSVLLPISTQFFFNYTGETDVSNTWAKFPSIMIGQSANSDVYKFENNNQYCGFNISTIGREYLRSPFLNNNEEIPFLHGGWRMRSAAVKIQYLKSSLQQETGGVLMPILHNNDSGQTQGVTNVVQVAAGGYHTVAVKGDGTVVAWGRNDDGQATVPAGLTEVTQVAAGGYHTVAVKADGTVVAWGYNGYGQTNVPQGLTGVAQVAAGLHHTVALKWDGTVVGWGSNWAGQTNVPPNLTDVEQVAAGGYHTVAVKFDGTVVAWGKNGNGQATVPAGLTGVEQVAAGGRHTVALKSDGTVVAWGSNYYGQTNVPQGLTGVTQVAAGGYHTVAVKGDGTVVAWGRNDDGQATVPAGLTDVEQVAAGELHTVALKWDGTVVAWGANTRNEDLVTSPVEFQFISDGESIYTNRGILEGNSGRDYTNYALAQCGSCVVLIAGNRIWNDIWRFGDTSFTDYQNQIPSCTNGKYFIAAAARNNTSPNNLFQTKYKEAKMITQTFNYGNNCGTYPFHGVAGCDLVATQEISDGKVHSFIALGSSYFLNQQLTSKIFIIECRIHEKDDGDTNVYARSAYQITAETNRSSAPTGFAASSCGVIVGIFQKKPLSYPGTNKGFIVYRKINSQISEDPDDLNLVNQNGDIQEITTNGSFRLYPVDICIADGQNPMCVFLVARSAVEVNPFDPSPLVYYSLCMFTGSSRIFNNIISLFNNRNTILEEDQTQSEGGLYSQDRSRLFGCAFETEDDSTSIKYVCLRWKDNFRVYKNENTASWTELLRLLVDDSNPAWFGFCRSANNKLLLVKSSGSLVNFWLLQDGQLIDIHYKHSLPISSKTIGISHFKNKLFIVKESANYADPTGETPNFTLEIGNVEQTEYKNGELRYSMLVHMHPTCSRTIINDDPNEERIPFLYVNNQNSELRYSESTTNDNLGSSMPNEKYGVICSAPADFGSAGVRYFFENTSSAFRVYKLSSSGFECVTRNTGITQFKNFGHGVLNDSYSLSRYRPLLEMPKNAPWGEMWSQISANTNRLNTTTNRFVAVGANVHVFLENSDDVSSSFASKNIPINPPITYRTYMNVRSAIVKANGDSVSALRSESSPGALPYQRGMIRYSINSTITVPFGSAEPISIKPSTSSLDRHSWMWWGKWVWQLINSGQVPSISDPMSLLGIESWWHSTGGDQSEVGASDRSDFLDGYVTAASSASALVVGNSRCISSEDDVTMQLKVYRYNATGPTNGTWTLATTVNINSVQEMGNDNFGTKYHPHSYLPQRLVLAVSDDANIICVAGHTWGSGSIPGVPKNTMVTILKLTNGQYNGVTSIVPPEDIDNYFATKMEIQDNPGGGYRLNILCSTDPVAAGQNFFSYPASNKTHSYILDTQGTPAKVAECTDLLPPAEIGFTNSGAANLNHWVATPSPAYNGNQTATWAGSSLVITTLNRIMSLQSSRFGWMVQSHTDRPFKFSDCKVLSSDFNTYQSQFSCPPDQSFCSNYTDVPKFPSPAAGNQMSDGRVRASFFIPQTVGSENDSGFYQVDNANSTQSGWFTAVGSDAQTLTLPHLAIGRALNSTIKDPQLSSADFDPGVQGRIFKVIIEGSQAGEFVGMAGDFGLVVRRPLFASVNGVSRLDWPFSGALTVLPKHFIRFSDEASAIRNTSANSLDIIDAGVIAPTFNSANIIVLKDGLDRADPGGVAVAYLAPSQWAEKSKNVVPSGQLVSLRISNSQVQQRSATTTGIFPETGSQRVSTTSQSFGIASPMAITVGGASACGAGAFDISKPCRSPIAPLEGRAFGSGSSPWMVVVERHTLDSTYFSYQGIDFGIRGISVTDASQLRMAEPFSVSPQSPFDPLGHMGRMGWCANRSYKVAGWSVATKDVIFGHLRDILDPKFGNVYNRDMICLASADGLGDPDGITSYVWAYPTPVSGVTTTKKCVCESDPYGGILWLKRLMSLPYTPKTSHLALRCLNGTGTVPDQQATMYSRFEAGASPLKALVFILTADIPTANEGITGANMASTDAHIRKSWAESVNNNLKSAEILTSEGGVHFVDLVKRPLEDTYRRACEILAEVSGGSYISLGRPLSESR
jgi:alpha-tubulin suppressor-like RCC1 family protein